jgi:hypothetical protein
MRPVADQTFEVDGTDLALPTSSQLAGGSIITSISSTVVGGIKQEA